MDPRRAVARILLQEDSVGLGLLGVHPGPTDAHPNLIADTFAAFLRRGGR